MTCPRCGDAMTEEALDGHLGRPITVDLCFGCQAFWFDARESLRLSPGSTLKLFRLIGERTDGSASAADETVRCPRCTGPLKRAQDLQRSTRFEYLKCPSGHGRFTTFFNFLREKDYIRQLTAKQIEELRQHVQVINCSNCGGPIDLTTAAACAHCGSPVSMLDMTQAETLIRQLKTADQPGRSADPTLPLALDKARREVHGAFDSLERDATWSRDASRSGLVTAGLHAIAKWLR